MGLHTSPLFIACRDCRELLPVDSPHTLALEEDHLTDADAYAAFFISHAAHRIACFWRSGSKLHASHPLWDPMATLTFEVTDGTDTYLVYATRTSVEEARVYRFEHGTLEVGTSEIEIDPVDLRRGLDGQFYPLALRPTKIDRFLSAVRDVLTALNPEELEIAFDAADDPSVSIACMPEETYDTLLARCAEIFDPWELPRVVAFLEENRNADGLLAVRVRRHLAALSA
jgi:hypothetical protein